MSYNVTPVEGEIGRFFVNSNSRPEIQHLVDTAYQEEPWMKPKIACSCEAHTLNLQTKGQHCPHINSVLEYLKKEKPCTT